MHFFNHCPHCKTKKLTPTMHENIEIDFCNKCGGLWFDKNELRQVITTYDKEFDEYEGANKTTDAIGYKISPTTLKCPRCSTNMDQHSYSDSFNLEIEVCKDCRGVWLEKEQFKLVLAVEDAEAALDSIGGEITIGTRIFQMLTSLPVEFNMKPKKLPIITYGLVAINILIFWFQLSSEPDGRMVKALAIDPSSFGTANWLFSLFSYQFLHGGYSHLIGNLYLLWVMGDNVEDSLGHGNYLAFYIVCGVMAGITESLVSFPATTLIIGASGSIAGIMAGYIVLFRKAKLTFNVSIFQWKISSFWYIGVWFLFNVINAKFSESPVAWNAHLGGFFTGLLLILINYKAILKFNPMIKLLNHHQSKES